MKRIAVVMALLLGLSLAVLAHEKGKHVMGTVTGISDNSITVQTTTKESVTVAVNDKTKFERSGSPASLKDLKVGDKVVVHADGSGNTLVANLVQFGATKSKQSMEGMSPH